MAVSANRLELLQIADAVAREKAIDRTFVITAMEDAIAKAARSRYGAETDVHAEINPKTGELKLTRHMLVVETVENPSNQIGVDDARKRNPAAQVGDTISDGLPPLEYISHVIGYGAMGATFACMIWSSIGDLDGPTALALRVAFERFVADDGPSAEDQAMDRFLSAGYQISSGNEFVKSLDTDRFVYRDNLFRGTDLLAAGVSVPRNKIGRAHV